MFNFWIDRGRQAGLGLINKQVGSNAGLIEVTNCLLCRVSVGRTFPKHSMRENEGRAMDNPVVLKVYDGLQGDRFSLVPSSRLSYKLSELRECYTAQRRVQRLCSIQVFGFDKPTLHSGAGSVSKASL